MHEGFRALTEASHALTSLGAGEQRALEEIARILTASSDCCVVLLLDADGARLDLAASSSQDVPLAEGLHRVFSPSLRLTEYPVLAAALERRQPLLVPRLTLDALPVSAAERQALTLAIGLRLHSVIVAPLRTLGQPLGLLLLGRAAASEKPFEPVDLQLVQSVAELTTLAISSARAVEAERAERLRLAERFRALLEASAQLAASSHDPRQLLELVAQRLTELVGDLCVIRATGGEGEWLDTDAAYCASPGQRAVLEAFGRSHAAQRRGEGLSGRAMGAEPSVTIANDDRLGQLDPPYRELLEQLHVTSVLTVPLRSRGLVVGVANLMRLRGRVPYTLDDGLLVQSVADYGALALFNARAYAAEQAALASAASAKLSMEDAQARFASLSSSGIIGVIVSKLDRSVAAINDTLCELLGYSREELVSGAVFWPSLTPPEWATSDLAALEQLLANAVPPLREKEFYRRDGTRVPVLVGSARVRSTDEIISFVLDLSETKRARLRIQELQTERDADARFRALVEAAPEAMVVATQTGQITLVNAQVERLFGFSRTELIGQPVEALLPERLGGAHREHRATYARTPIAREMASNLDLRGRRKDGSEFAVEVSLSPLQTAGGLLVLSSIRDVTERRRAERHLADLAAIVSASDDAIIGKTLRGEITSWNPGAERLFGHSAGEAIGQSIQLIIPPTKAAEEPAILLAAARGQVQRFDTVRLRKDGSLVDVAVTVSPVRDAQGVVVGISKVVQDISARIRAEEDLRRAKEAAEAAGRELEAFSYSVAHDLRAPLRGMNGFARVLLDTYGQRFDAEGRDWLEEIMNNAQRMGALIDALLTLSRVTRADFQPSPVDLGALARSTFAALKAANPERTVELATVGELQARLDPNLARALVENLVGNAFKFTSRTPNAHIVLQGLDRDGERVFCLSDDGAGFDMTFAGKLFAPFQRLHRSSEFPGTGIGLATVQRIVRRHGGRIWAEGHPGLGASFSFVVSAAPEVASHEETDLAR